MNIENKNIFFVSPRFFGYEIEICKKLREFGANVHYVDDRFDNGAFVKAILRLRIGNTFLRNKIKQYFLKELALSGFAHIDYVFALTPEAFSEDILKIFREKFPDCKYILYMWDSFKNRKNTPNILKYFDCKFSFDNTDAINYQLTYLPLFYLDEYSKIAKKSKYEFDVSFIGTAHSDRIIVAKKIVEKLETKKFYLYFYFQNKLLYYFNKLTNPSFKNVSLDDICFNPIQKDIVKQIIDNSKIIIDIHHTEQEGLTMRTIEMLGARKKLITTNKNVVDHDFYHPKNIHVVDRSKINIEPSFLDQEYLEIDEKIFSKYSLHNWIQTLFKF